MTPNQSKVYSYIYQFISAHDYAPSFLQIGEACGLKSKSQTFSILRSLEEQGKITRRKNRHRAIELVRPPVQSAVATAPLPELILELNSRGYVVGSYINSNFKPLDII